jgi:integrase
MVPYAAGAALAAWLQARGEAPGPLFVNFDRASKGRAQGQEGRLTGNGIYAIVTALGRQAGVAVRPHGLRHASITTALDLGLDVRVVRHHSDHASVQVLLDYDDARQDFAGQVAERVAAVL